MASSAPKPTEVKQTNIQNPKTLPHSSSLQQQQPSASRRRPLLIQRRTTTTTTTLNPTTPSTQLTIDKEIELARIAAEADKEIELARIEADKEVKVKVARITAEADKEIKVKVEVARITAEADKEVKIKVEVARIEVARIEADKEVKIARIEAEQRANNFGSCVWNRPKSASSDWSNRTQLRQAQFRETLIEQYNLAGPIKDTIRCQITGEVFPSECVTAAHLWPIHHTNIFTMKTGLPGRDIWSYRNGLMMLKKIEEAYDYMQVTIIPNSLDHSCIFYVLDPDLHTQVVKEGSNITFGSLHGKAITLGPGKLPFTRVLAFHANSALEVARNTGKWKKALGANLQSITTVLALSDKAENSLNPDDYQSPVTDSSQHLSDSSMFSPLPSPSPQPAQSTTQLSPETSEKK